MHHDYNDVDVFYFHYSCSLIDSKSWGMTKKLGEKVRVS